MADFLQGTTPTLIFDVWTPDGSELADLTNVVGCRLIVTQPGRLKPLVATFDAIINRETSEVSYTFKERETMALNPKKDLIYQCRFVTDDETVFGVTAGKVTVEELYNDRKLIGGLFE